MMLKINFIIFISLLLLINFLSCDLTTIPDSYNIIYEEEVYGDFIVIFQKVRHCMNMDNAPPTRIILVDKPFYFAGVLASGVYNQYKEEIQMVAPPESISKTSNNLSDTKGALYSHELVHYLKRQRGDTDWNLDKEDESFLKCGTIQLENFHY